MGARAEKVSYSNEREETNEALDHQVFGISRLTR